MTTVAALARGGEVWFAADSRNVVYDRPIIDGARKIRRMRVGNDEHALLGVCGDGALADMLSHRIELRDAPERDEDEEDLWAADVADHVTELALARAIVDDGRLDGTLLLGFRGRLWTITHYQAIVHRDGVAALGSGEALAMGVMDALREGPLDPDVIVRRALEVAVARDIHSAAPIYVLSEKAESA